MALEFMFEHDGRALLDLDFVSVRQAVETSVSSFRCSLSSAVQFHEICSEVGEWALLNRSRSLSDGSSSVLSATTNQLITLEVSVHKAISQLEAFQQELLQTACDGPSTGAPSDINMMLVVDAIATFKPGLEMCTKNIMISEGTSRASLPYLVAHTMSS